MATAALNKLLAGLAPPPFVQPVNYDGLEFKWKIFVFRPGLFKTEAYLLGAIVFYIVWVFFGASVNKKKANKWLEAHLPIYEQQFSMPSKGGLIEDGHSDFFNYSTGRRNIESLHTIFRLRPRHDLLQWGFQTGRTFVDLHYKPEDEVQLDFKLAPGACSHSLVWAVVAKDELRNVKDDRWDLTFTKTTENSALSASLSVMSEYADVTDNMLKPLGNFSLLNFLKDPKILPYFRSLSVTDQPRQRPLVPIPADEREWHVILSLQVADSSCAADTAAIISAMFGFIDSLNKLHIHPEIKSKLKKSREDLDKELKAEVQKEKQEHLSQVVEDKKVAKRKVEEERIAKLSAVEQQKILEKERKKTFRKTQARLVRK